MFWRRKKQKVAAYPDQLDLLDLGQMSADAYIMRMEYEWKQPEIPPGSCSSYGNELYEFVGYGTSGTNQYKDQYGRFVEFSINDLVIVCKYCGSKNNQKNFKCDSCGANL